MNEVYFNNIMAETIFITDDFLLYSEAAIRLYHDFAKPQPIFDYHCHLSSKDIAEDRQFENLAQIWSPAGLSIMPPSPSRRNLLGA